MADKKQDQPEAQQTDQPSPFSSDVTMDPEPVEVGTDAPETTDFATQQFGGDPMAAEAERAEAERTTDKAEDA